MVMLESSKKSLVSFQIAYLDRFSGSPPLSISLQIAASAVWEQKGRDDLKSLIFLLLEPPLSCSMAL